MMDHALQGDLEDLRSRGLHRTMRRIDRIDGPRAVIDGRDVLVFGSNNYLGLAGHPEVRRAAAQAAAEWGAGSTGSRLTTGNFALHEDIEREIASLKGADAAVLFGSGYLAAVGTIPALVAIGDLILSDELNHACLIDGCRLSRATVRVYRHGDVGHAQELLADRDLFRRCLVVTDGVFSMDGDIAPLAELADLCAEHNAWLMVDDAHGTGVLGETGAGSAEHCGLKAQAIDGLIQMGTLSKALGSEGGFVAGSDTLVDYLRNRARSFVFSTAPSPPSTAAALAALRLIRSEPERRKRLIENARRLVGGLARAGFRLSAGAGLTPIVSVVIGEADGAVDMARDLFDQGIYVPAIRPPTVPEGTSRLRMNVLADHTDKDIRRAINAMEALR